MSDDWQVGDLALCLAHKWEEYHCFNPQHGQILRVTSVRRSDCVGLSFEGIPQDEFYAARAFRKIRPDAEPCEEEFVTMIKRMKPAKVTS